MKRTIVYIDGFNLYHGCLKGSNLKWLNLHEAIQRHVGMEYRFKAVKYFTARLGGDASDPKRPQRQDVYLRAFRANGVEVFLGEFKKRKTFWKPTATHDVQTFGSSRIELERYEEKQTDVALATRMVADAAKDEFDWAVLVTNDSDQIPSIRLVQNEFGKSVYVINPHIESFQVREMQITAHAFRNISRKILSRCQMDDEISTSDGLIRRPPPRRAV